MSQQGSDKPEWAKCGACGYQRPVKYKEYEGKKLAEIDPCFQCLNSTASKYPPEVGCAEHEKLHAKCYWCLHSLKDAYDNLNYDVKRLRAENEALKKEIENLKNTLPPMSSFRELGTTGMLTDQMGNFYVRKP